MFISMQGFNKACWLNLVTLYTFFKNNVWFHACCKFLAFFSFELAASFSTFLSVKKGKSLRMSSNFFEEIERQLQKISFITIFIVVLYKIFTKLRRILKPLKSAHKQLVALPIHISYLHPNSWLSKIIYFIIIFHVFIINF